MFIKNLVDYNIRVDKLIDISQLSVHLLECWYARLDINHILL